MSKHTDLDQEYSPKAAKRALHRAAQQQRIINQCKAIEAQPIDDPAQLSDMVAQLASAWGLKKRGRS